MWCLSAYLKRVHFYAGPTAFFVPGTRLLRPGEQLSCVSSATNDLKVYIPQLQTFPKCKTVLRYYNPTVNVEFKLYCIGKTSTFSTPSGFVPISPQVTRYNGFSESSATLVEVSECTLLNEASTKPFGRECFPCSRATVHCESNLKDGIRKSGYP
jgi:hypothetical protein